MKSFLLATLLFSIPALSADIKMLEVTSDEPSAVVSIIAIQVQPDFTIENVVYKNPTKPIEVWTVADLNKNKVTLLQKNGISIVEISAQTMKKDDIVFNITYLYKYGLFGSDRRVKQLRMHYVAPSNLFETVDMDTQKVVTHAVFVARIEGGKQKGVDHIDTY